MFRMLNIRLKLGLALLVLTIFTLLSGLMNFQARNKTDASQELFAVKFMTAQSAILNADRDLYQANKAMLDALLASSNDNLDDFMKEYDENAQQAYDRMHVYIDSMKKYPEIVASLSQFEARFTTWNSEGKQFWRMILQGKKAQAEAFYQRNISHFGSLRDEYDIAGERLAEQNKKIYAQSQQLNASSRITDVTLSAAAVVVGLLFLIFLPRSISSSINSLKSKIDDISHGEGDLVSRIPVTSEDELGKLTQSFNRLLDHLQTLIHDVKSDVSLLDDKTSILNDIATKTESISHNQANKLTYLTNSYDDIFSSSQAIYESAQNAAAQSQEVLTSAKDGMIKLDSSIDINHSLSASIQTAGERISKLSAESDKITSVLDEIRNIADQTNLLALNAAIEAARAGEQGRGFAVVADEVRTLAQRTQNSTEDIQTMLSLLIDGVDSTKTAMDQGCQLMSDSLATTENMRASFLGIQDLIMASQQMNEQIVDGTEHQTSVMAKVNDSVSHIQDLTTEQNQVASSVAKAGVDVSSLAANLAARMNKFKV